MVQSDVQRSVSCPGAAGSLSKVSLLLCGALALACAPNCSKSEPKAKVEPATVESDPVVAADANTADAEKLANQKKVKEAIEKFETDWKEEQARWTDEMEASTKKLVEKSFKTPKQAIAAALASAHRVPGHADRDSQRHPQETLEFMGLTPKTRVVEMGVGSGWYTEILAPVVAKAGQLTIGTWDAEGPDDQMTTVYGVRQAALLGKSDALFGKVKSFPLSAEGAPRIGETGSADLVLAIREMHGWQRRGTLDATLAAIADVLAPGGRLGIVQHRANADANVEESVELGYLPEAWVIAKVEAAGLKLVKKSEINANPKDTKDYEKGVWTLPPNLRLGDTDREKYAAIGESDRMTLLFEKPKSK